MSELLPVTITSDTHPYLLKICMSYRPYKELYIDTDLCSDDIKNKSYVSMKELTSDLGLEYNKEVDKRR